jgi:hypothetical protein
MTSTNRTEAALTTAYHLIYDAKDTTTPGTTAFVQAADALRTLAALMDTLAITSPVRFDA